MENILENVRTYFHGKMNFVAGICQKLKVSEIIEKSIYLFSDIFSTIF